MKVPSKLSKYQNETQKCIRIVSITETIHLGSTNEIHLDLFHFELAFFAAYFELQLITC